MTYTDKDVERLKNAVEHLISAVELELPKRDMAERATSARCAVEQLSFDPEGELIEAIWPELRRAIGGDEFARSVARNVVTTIVRQGWVKGGELVEAARR